MEEKSYGKPLKEMKQRELVRPHLESFNFMMEKNGGFDQAMKTIMPARISKGDLSADIDDPPTLKGKHCLCIHLN
jgi:hypothetical protein